jgi:DNA-binding response OmpR family regulator
MLPKIYIVEDNPMVGEMMRQALVQEQYEVKLFETGRAILDAMVEQPDIVVLDYQLPDISGLEILEKVRSNYPKTIAIIYSGQEDVNVVVEAYNNGAKNYIVKTTMRWLSSKTRLRTTSLRFCYRMKWSCTVRSSKIVQSIRILLEKARPYTRS